MIKLFFLLLLSLLPLSANDSPLLDTSPPLSTSIQPVEPIDSSQQASSLDSSTKDYEKAFIKMIFFLVGLLILVFVVFFLFKRFSHSRMQHNNHFRMIKVLERRPISPKSILYLVEIGGKKVLLAESQLEIRHISHLEWLEVEKKGL